MSIFNFNKYFAKTEEVAVDPVCGMRVLRNEKLQVKIDNETYFFCSQGCLNQFSRDQEKFIKH